MLWSDSTGAQLANAYSEQRQRKPGIQLHINGCLVPFEEIWAV